MVPRREGSPAVPLPRRVLAALPGFLPEWQHLPIVSAHEGSDLRGSPFRRRLHRVRGKVSIPGGRPDLGVAGELADHRQAFAGFRRGSVETGAGREPLFDDKVRAGICPRRLPTRRSQAQPISLSPPFCFARLAAHRKRKIVRALKAERYVVDAPVAKETDIGTGSRRSPEAAAVSLTVQSARAGRACRRSRSL